MSDTLEVTSPYDGSVVGTLQLASEAEVESALSIASDLYLDRSRWLPPHERISILERLAAIMERKKEHLTEIALQEGGKPYRDSVIEVDRAIQGVRLGVHALGELRGEQIPMGLTPPSTGRLAYTIPEPAGVVVSFSAFNHPLNLIVHQTIPAVAAGCPVIVKPAPATPLSCFEFVKLLHEAGYPKEWCQPLVCSNELAGKLVSDPRVAFLSFIGSARVGWHLRSTLAPGARCALEHGGAAPVIVAEGADIESMLPLLLKGGFYHAGQVCVSVQRVYVPAGQAEEIATQLADMASKLNVGDPARKDTDIGPLIRAGEVTRVDEWVQEAEQGGAKVLCGGKPVSDSCYAPTVLLNPSPEARVSREEIFGPVVCVYGYSDRMQAIEQANALPFAFQASVFTNDLDVAFDTVQRLKAMAVMVNDHTAFRVDWMPFGGSEVSGLGLGGIQYSAKDMTREKLMVFRSSAFA